MVDHRYWIVRLLRRGGVRLAATVLVISGVARPAIAQNVVQFLPGDAYFYVALPESVVRESPKDGGDLLFPYGVNDEGFGSTAGFGLLRINGLSPKVILHLRLAYRAHRKDVPKIMKPHHGFLNPDGSPQLIEVNAPHLFVYNKDVDWVDQRLALKYNENWPHLPADAFLPPGRGEAWTVFRVSGRAEVYQPLIKTYEATVEDWRNAHRFKPLKVEVPKNVAWGIFGPPIDQPVVAQADDIQFVLIPGDGLAKCFAQKKNAVFYQITKDGVKKCTWRKRDVEVTLEQELLAEEPDNGELNTTE